MKYINLEHWASIHSSVLFAYKSQKKKSENEGKEKERR